MSTRRCITDYLHQPYAFWFHFCKFCCNVNLCFSKLKINIHQSLYHHRLSITNRITKTRLSLYCYKMVSKPRSLLSVLIIIVATCHGCHLTNMSQLFWIVISCKIARGSRKFKFFHKIDVIHEKFLVLLKLSRGPDKTRSRVGSGPRAAGGASLMYIMVKFLKTSN